MLLDMDGAYYAQHEAYNKAIKLAAAKGHQSALQVLFERGRALGADRNYTQALRDVLPNGIEAMIAQTMRIVDAKGRTKGNALQLAASKGNSEDVVRLLRDGADINHSSGVYGTALAAAAKHGDLTLVQLLLDEGANVNAKHGLYGTALHQAVVHRHEAVISRLLEYGAKIEFQTSRGPRSALHRAMSNGNVAIVRLLLAHKANINATSEVLVNGEIHSNITPCEVAAGMGHEVILKLLLQRGADINAGKGQAALRIAKRFGHERIVDLLHEYGARLDEGDATGSKLQQMTDVVSFRPIL